MDMFKLAYQETDPERIKELLSFYIVGGGASGVEMAGELAELVPFACAKYHIDPKLVRVVNVDFLSRLLNFVPENISAKATRRLEKIGVTVTLNTKVVRIAENEISLETDGTTITEPTRTVIWTAGTQGSDIMQMSEQLGLAARPAPPGATPPPDAEPAPAIVPAARSLGRVQTDKYLRSKQHQNVYVAGDNIFYIPEGEERAVPQMVENCEASAPVVAQNIVSEVSGVEPSVEFKPTFHGAMVCIGGRYGVAHVGSPGKRVALPSFLAMLAKHFMNIVLFTHILGWNKVYSYITHEFFTIRNRRSFLGGHFSNRSITVFSVPLRVFLGVFMLYKGYVNAQLGWFETTKLRDVFFDVAGQFRPLAPYMPDINILDRIHFSIVVSGGEMTMWLQTTVVNWFFQTIVFASEASEMFFQRLIVVFLILLGLALVSGLLTTLASIGAIVVAVVMIITVGLPFSMWWIPFAAIALLFTGGRVFSLDYYVMPWLSKRWKNKESVQRLYIYND
jgi:NADH dehydrogenase